MKKVLYIIIGLIAIVCILGLVAPNDFAVERKVVINKPKDQVFEFVKYLKNQDLYSSWARKDPAMKREFRGTDGEAGAVSGWEGNKEVGKGEQEIRQITPGERIDFELRFKKPFEATNKAYMITEAAGTNQTLVKWGFSGRMPFPMNAMMLFVNMDKQAGKDFEIGLANLKELLEKQ